MFINFYLIFLDVNFFFKMCLKLIRKFSNELNYFLFNFIHSSDMAIPLPNPVKNKK